MNGTTLVEAAMTASASLPASASAAATSAVLAVGSHADSVWSDALLLRVHLTHADVAGFLKSFAITTVGTRVR